MIDIFQKSSRASGFNIRKARVEDAKQIMELVNSLAAGGNAFPTNKLIVSEEQQKKFILKMGKTNIILVAELERNIIGWLSLIINYFSFKTHSGSLFIGIKREFQNKTIGSKLMKTIESMALLIGISRLEASIQKDNTTAINFFMKQGFLKEGEKIKSIKKNGIYINEILFYKVLD